MIQDVFRFPGILRQVEELKRRGARAREGLLDDLVVRGLGVGADQFPLPDAEAVVAGAAVVLLDEVLPALGAGPAEERAVVGRDLLANFVETSSTRDAEAVEAMLGRERSMSRRFIMSCFESDEEDRQRCCWCDRDRRGRTGVQY